MFLNFGGNLPTTPWSSNSKGKGSLEQFSFEDNAEFGLGMRLSADKQLQMAHFYAEKLKPELGEDFIMKSSMPSKLESQIIKQRERVEILK